MHRRDDHHQHKRARSNYTHDNTYGRGAGRGGRGSRRGRGSDRGPARYHPSMSLDPWQELQMNLERQGVISAAEARVNYSHKVLNVKKEVEV